MHKRISSTAVAVSLGVISSLAVGVSAASAEVSQETATAIVDASLQNLATEPVSDELADELVQGVVAADEVGLIDSEIIDAVTEIIAEDPATDQNAGATDGSSDSNSIIDNPVVDDLLDERLEGDQERWDDIAPAWMEAFETIRADFEGCRTDGQSTSACARTLGFSLQLAHAQVVLAEIDARTAELADLPEEERAVLLAELEAERAAVEARLARAEAKLAALPADQATVRSEKLTEVLTQVRVRAEVTTGADRAAVVTQQGGGQGVPGQGNAGTGSGSSGSAPQQANPSAPSQRPSQAAVPSNPSSSQSPGQSNRPATPGNSGASNGKANDTNRGNSGQ